MFGSYKKGIIFFIFFGKIQLTRYTKLCTFIDKAIQSRKVPVENITEFLFQQKDDYHPAHHPIASMEILRQCVVYKLENLEK